MIGPILLAVSWLLLRLEGKGLGALGLNAPAARGRQFAAGFLVAGLAVAIQQLGLSAVTGVPWRLNPNADLTLFTESLRWNVNSVLYEELVFRGYLLYQAIRWLGERRAVLLGAAAFGVYHWFSYGVLGNPVLMSFVFLFTGAFGFMLALAFARTKSIALPIGLHLGWNLVSYLGFSGGPQGPGLLVPANGATRLDATGLPDFLLDMMLPMVLVAIVSWYLFRRYASNGIFAATSSEPPGPDAPEIAPEPLTSAVAADLIAALNAELSALYPEPGATHFRLDPSEVAPGTGIFVVARWRQRPVGCGALRSIREAALVRELGPRAGELKRMYVEPKMRGHGVGRAVLDRLEAEARTLGLTRLVLETGTRQVEALALYRRAGFTPIPPYGEYAASSTTSVCLAKAL